MSGLAQAARPPAASSPGAVAGLVHALLPSIIEGAMATSLRIEAHGFEHWSRSPSTLIVCNHRRDSDALVVAAICLDRHRLRAHGILPGFVAREDLFRRGFLADYLEGWPSPLQRLLAAIDVTPVLEAFAVQPMRRVPERTLAEVLDDVRECFGDLPVADVLRPALRARVARHLHEPADARIDEVLRRAPRELLRRPYGFFALTRKRLAELADWERRAIRRHLLAVAERLEAGETMLLAPEGGVSPDGCFRRVRLGAHLLLESTRRLVRVLPVGISYDDDTDWRTRAIVRAGPEIVDLQGASRRTTAERISRAILAQTSVTTAQLAARHLLRDRRAGGDGVDDALLGDAIARRARVYRDCGAAVDPRLLDPDEASRCAARWLRGARRRGWLARGKRGRHRVLDAQGLDRALHGLDNELRSLERHVLPVRGRSA